MIFQTQNRTDILSKSYKKITSGHRSTQPHFHGRNQFRIWTGSPIGHSHVKLFDVANQGHYYIVNSMRTWEYPMGDPVQILNWFLTWKWGCVLLWPEVIFFLVNPALPRTISIDKKNISSGTQGNISQQWEANLWQQRRRYTTGSRLLMKPLYCHNSGKS